MVAHLRETVNLDVPVEPVETIAASDRPPFGDAKTCEPTPMPRFGTGRKLLVTGSTHDEWGYRRTTDSAVQARLVERITGKVVRDRVKLAETEQYNTDDAEVVLVSFGCSARSSHAAMRLAREEGRKVGLLRLKALWPFAQEKIREVSGSAKKLVVVEMNRGMMRREVERFSSADVIGCHKTSGEPITPLEIIEVL